MVDRAELIDSLKDYRLALKLELDMVKDGLDKYQDVFDKKKKIVDDVDACIESLEGK